jgi:hypothetical protein
VTLHALQAFPPSLLNRDDNNAIKQITFGGAIFHGQWRIFTKRRRNTLMRNVHDTMLQPTTVVPQAFPSSSSLVL